jgi:heat shock protein HslJ
MKRKTGLFILIISCLASCNSQRNINKTADASISITGKEWVAVEVDNEKITQQDTSRLPNLKLAEGKISGYSSCNRMHGTYTLEKGKISFGAIAVTKMFCFDTKDLEDKFLKAISEVKFWEYKQNKLYFLNEKKQIIIVFEEKK